MHFLLKSLSPLQSGTEQSPVITINLTRLYVCLNLNGVCVCTLCVPLYIYRRQYIYSIYNIMSLKLDSCGFKQN